MELPETANLADYFLFDRLAEGLGDKPALLYGDRRYTYEQVAQRTRAMATLLARTGVRRGERVLVVLPDTPPFAWVFYGVLARGAVVAMGFGRRWLFQGGGLDTLNVLANVTVIPLSLYMYLPSVAKMMWLPQAWSLGTELCFYAVFPLIWRSRAVAWAAAVCGWLVLALAMSGVLDPDWYGYRLLPGTLPFFLLGRAMFTRDRAMMSALLVLLAGLGVFVVATSRLGLGYNRELLLAALAGPALLALALRVPAWRHDAVLGHVSYGTYLAHICVLAMLFDVHSLAARAVAGAVLAVAGGGLGWWLVERPVLRLRRRLRG